MTQRTSITEGVRSCKNTTKKASRPLSMVFSESLSISDSDEVCHNFSVKFGRGGRGKLPKVTELEVSYMTKAIDKYFHRMWKHIDHRTILEFSVKLSRDLVIVLEESQKKELCDCISSIKDLVNALKPSYRLNFWTE